MPYKSDAQRKKMHADPRLRPIAERWDKKYGGKVSKASKKEWAVGLGTATVGGALANQVPPVRRKKKKGTVNKLHAPVRKDGWYNQRAADEMFSLIMKMDDDTAQVFSYIVCSDIFETTVENNLGTIQKALNQVFDERMERVKKALINLAQTTDDPRVVEYAKAVKQVEEFSKVTNTPQYYGYTWKESDFKRDPGTGRFAVKVHHTMEKPLGKKKAENLIGNYGPTSGLNDKQRARYQDEYRQVASFLEGVQNTSGTGTVDIVYHLKDKAGNHFTELSNSASMPHSMLENNSTELTAIEAKPNVLTAGGAAYGLMGGITGNQMARVDSAFTNDPDQGGIKGAVRAWETSGNEREQTSQMFNRLQTTGGFANQFGPPGSKVQIAGKMAEIVGEFGPEAEKVIGPSARKTAYRYRGTEKKPDKALVRGYAKEIADAKRYGIEEEEVDQRLLGFGTVREPGRGDILPFGQRRATGARERRPEQVTPAVGQMAQAQALQAARKPTWAERGAGSAVVASYLRQKLPDKNLYRLHTNAGNTPPSEGVIINADGQLAVQAVGYGDDHYLPFNLKNLKSLKGGEYIRNRSVGGLTSEDVYTGLMMGARRVTVVSRSGTFTMEFEEDFRGGRRHNDKALRMTRRYENILDAVQSGQVDRQNIPIRWRNAIKDEVAADFPPDTPKVVLREEVDRRIKEFKENPDVEGRDLERAETMIADMESKAALGYVTEKDAADFRTSVMNSLYDMKEVRFRLNGIGYEAGLKSLQEQFPYYIKDVKTRPTKDEELLEFELDEGYVEPGRNRPTRVRAGLYGTGLEPNTKYSAALADYQRGRAGGVAGAKGAFKPLTQQQAALASTAAAAPAAAAAPGTGLEAGPGQAAVAEETSETGLSAGPGQGAAEPEAEGAGFKAGPGQGQKAGESGEKGKKDQQGRDAVARNFKLRSAKKVARELRDDLKTANVYWAEGEQPEWWDYGDEAFEDYVAKPEGMDTFHRDMERQREKFSSRESGLPHFSGLWARFQEARGAVKEVKYQKSLAGHFPPQPYSFAELETKDAYHSGARYAEVKAEMSVIDGRDTATNFTSTKKLSELTTDEMRDEIEQTQDLRQAASGASAEAVLTEFNRIWPTQTHPTSRLVPMLTKPSKLDEHLEQVHRMRYLQEMLKQSKNAPTGPSASSNRPSSGGSSGGSAGFTGGSSSGPSRPSPRPSQPPPEPTKPAGKLVPTEVEPEAKPQGALERKPEHDPNWNPDQAKIIADAKKLYLENAYTSIKRLRTERDKPSTSPDQKHVLDVHVRRLATFSRDLQGVNPDKADSSKFVDTALDNLEDSFTYVVNPERSGFG